MAALRAARAPWILSLAAALAASGCLGGSGGSIFGPTEADETVQASPSAAPRTWPPLPENATQEWSVERALAGAGVFHAWADVHADAGPLRLVGQIRITYPPGNDRAEMVFAWIDWVSAEGHTLGARGFHSVDPDGDYRVEAQVGGASLGPVNLANNPADQTASLVWSFNLTYPARAHDVDPSRLHLSVWFRASPGNPAPPSVRLGVAADARRFVAGDAETLEANVGLLALREGDFKSDSMARIEAGPAHAARALHARAGFTVETETLMLGHVWMPEIHTNTSLGEMTLRVSHNGRTESVPLGGLEHRADYLFTCRDCSAGPWSFDIDALGVVNFYVAYADRVPPRVDGGRPLAPSSSGQGLLLAAAGAH